MSHPTRQHYVPRMLLREFADPETRRVSVYDKHEDRTFQAKPARIAVVNEFYDLEISELVRLSTEEGLSEVEWSASQVFDEIRSEESLTGIDPEEMALISIFIAIQK